MLAIIALGSIAHAAAETVFPRLSPQYRFAFQNPLAIPQVKEPSASYTNPQNQVPIDFYEIKSKPFTHKFFPNLAGESDLLGYDGTFPGPTIRVQKGRQTVIRVVNEGQDQMNLHLHGSYSTFQNCIKVRDTLIMFRSFCIRRLRQRSCLFRRVQRLLLFKYCRKNSLVS